MLEHRIGVYALGTREQPVFHFTFGTGRKRAQERVVDEGPGIARHGIDLDHHWAQPEVTEEQGRVESKGEQRQHQNRPCVEHLGQFLTYEGRSPCRKTARGSESPFAPGALTPDTPVPSATVQAVHHHCPHRPSAHFPSA